MSKSINGAVLDLVARGKLSAVSCAVNHPACEREDLEALGRFAPVIDRGLHLVLTEEGRPWGAHGTGSLRQGAGFCSFGALLRRSWLRRLERDDVKGEIAAQYERFEILAGRRPEFIDGHLHAHQFPVIREALLDFVCELPALERPYVRNTWIATRKMMHAGASLPKSILISRPGTVFRRKAMCRGLATNTGFAGIYHYSPGSDFTRLFGRFLASTQMPNDMLVVHPGSESWRRQEYETLREWQPAPLTPNRFIWNRT